MKWRGRRQSENVEDRRSGRSAGKKVATGGGIIGVVALLLTLFGGENGQQIGQLLNQINSTSQTEQTTTHQITPKEKELGQFVSTVFADTEDVWEKIFINHNAKYQRPSLVLFSNTVQSSCGASTAAAGPFYCPADQKIYMDLVFFDELRTRFGAKGGDFAIAYVLAHEVGHHIQTLLGTSQKVQQQKQRLNQIEGNKLSVCLELQADFFAGVWAHHNKKFLEAGDIEEAMSAAHAVGDDAIQKRVRGHVTPDSFTHGSSAKRKKWFYLGYKTGDINKRNTFAAAGYRGFE